MSDILVKENKRLLYLDALRGFTMILVVLNHVSAEFFGVTYNPENFHYYIAEGVAGIFIFLADAPLGYFV